MDHHRLFSPLAVNGMKLQNRLVMTALQCNYTPGGYCSERFIRFYEERAKGGVGLLIVGGCRFDQFCGSTWDMMSLMDDSYIEGLRIRSTGMAQRQPFSSITPAGMPRSGI